MKLKNRTVDVRFLHPQVVAALWNIENIFVFNTESDFVFLITSGNDGKHSATSLHYKCRAIDVRIRYPDGRPLSVAEKDNILGDLIRFFGREFDIVLEVDHFHIELDPNFS